MEINRKRNVSVKKNKQKVTKAESNIKIYKSQILEIASDKCSAVADMGDRLATIDISRKLGAVPLLGVAGSPCNTMWPGPKPTFVPSGILIHPTVWPHQRCRQDRQTDRPFYKRSPKNGSWRRKRISQKTSQKMTLAKSNIIKTYKSQILQIESENDTNKSEWRH